MNSIIRDVTDIRDVQGNKSLIPSLKLFGVLKEGFYDCLKQRIVMKISNISEIHLTSERSFFKIRDLIQANYDALDKDFTDILIFQLTLPRRLKYFLII